MSEAKVMPRPQLVAPRRAQTLEAVRGVAAGNRWDPDVWHVIEQRDNALIADEILHGAGSNRFVYKIEIAGTEVSGISVIGARHLAFHYGGLKHRLVSSIHKTGSLFVFTTFPAEGVGMQVTTAKLFDLEGDPDFFGALAEVSDIKTGNSVQMERNENRFEKTRLGTWYERPNYAMIAQSKAYRNGILALVPQDVQIQWKQRMLELGKSEIITGSVIDEKRSNVLRFATAKGLALDRRIVEELTLDQISGLGDAAREGAVPAFVNAAKALGLDLAQAEPENEPEPVAPTPRRGRPPKRIAPQERDRPIQNGRVEDEPTRSDPANSQENSTPSDTGRAEIWSQESFAVDPPLRPGTAAIDFPALADQLHWLARDAQTVEECAKLTNDNDHNLRRLQISYKQGMEKFNEEIGTRLRSLRGAG